LLLGSLLIASRGVKSKETGSVAAEDVALLLPAEKRSVVNDGDCWLDYAKPSHLVRPEHNALAEASIN